MHTNKINLSKYMTIPYARGGRSEALCDCWGLSRLILNNEAGLDLPEHDKHDRTALFAVAGVIKVEKNSGAWLPVEKAQTWDVALMSGQVWYKRKWWNGVFHIGVYVDGKILHTEIETGPVFVPVGHGSIRHRIDSYYRHEKLAI